MHILQLVPKLEVGGVERGVIDLSRGLIKLGHRVTVVSTGGPLVGELEKIKAGHFTLNVHDKSPFNILQNTSQLAGIIQDLQVDIVHARSRVPAWSGYLACRKTGVPFITTCHGFYRPHLMSRVMSWGELVIVPSEALGRYVMSEFGLSSQRIRIVPRGVDLDEFIFRNDTQAPINGRSWRLGIVGRLTPIKGHEVAIRALHQLIRSNINARLCMIGDSPNDRQKFRKELEGLALSLEVEDRIEWMGLQSDVPGALASLDIVLIPSVYPESFGRSAIEAQAVGVPVIASNIGALGEIISHEKSGLLFDAGDATKLANSLKRLIQDEKLRLKLVDEGRKSVESLHGLEKMVKGTLSVYEECIRQPRIVVWKLSALGDVVLASPSLRSIRQNYPGSWIGLVVGRAASEAVIGCPYINEILIYDPKRKEKNILGKLRMIRSIKKRGFRVSIDLQNSRLTHLLAYLCGIPVRIGYARKFARLLNRPVSLPDSKMHPVAHQRHLLEKAGVAFGKDDIEIWPSEFDEAQAQKIMSDAGISPIKPVAGIHPGSSQRWNTKRWAIEKWAALCDRLDSLGFQVVITGSPSEHELAISIAKLTKRTSPFVIVGKTRLLELACLLRKLSVFITTDSAPLHVAAAMRVATVALFGPTDPKRHAPNSENVYVIKHDIVCSPCYSPRCKIKTHECMNEISVDEVMSLIEAKILANKPNIA